MLFRGIESYLLNYVTPRSMPHLTAYIDTLNVRRGLLTDRISSAAGFESNLIVMLRNILANAEIPLLLNKPSDLERYYDILVYTTPRLNAIFDAVTTGLTFHDMAIRRSPAHTEEFFIPVSCRDPSTDLPFDQGWDVWQTVKPLRLVDIDSLELTFSTLQDQIVFSKISPSRAVMTIDVVAMVLQYIAFLSVDDQSFSQPEYLHRYVMVHLLQDLEDLWLVNVYDRMIADPDSSANPKVCLSHIQYETQYGFPGVELLSALQEISTLISTCRRGSITPAVVLRSLLLSHESVPGFLETLLNTTTTDERIQSNWMEYLRDIRWLKLMYDVYQLQPDFVATKNLKNNLKRDIPILIAMRPWMHARSPTVRNFMEHDFKNRLAALI